MTGEQLIESWRLDGLRRCKFSCRYLHLSTANFEMNIKGTGFNE